MYGKFHCEAAVTHTFTPSGYCKGGVLGNVPVPITIIP